MMGSVILVTVYIMPLLSKNSQYNLAFDELEAYLYSFLLMILRCLIDRGYII